MKKIILLIIIIIVICLIPIPNKKDDVVEYKAIIYQIKKSPNEESITILGFKHIKNIDFKQDEESKEIIKTVDDFYNQEITKDYLDLRKLTKQYTIEQAIEDNCFVISDDVHNDSQFPEFFDNYENKKTSFIRTVVTTIEGDLIIYDLMYDSNTDSLYAIVDVSRDRYSSVSNLEVLKYEKMEMYTYQNNTYWVLYNGELTNESLFGENTLIISYV